jgi:type I restriction-modification system DNA methylase subunit
MRANKKQEEFERAAGQANMAMTKEDAKEKIAELLSKYEHLNPFEVKDYHEAKTRQGFVLPMFQYLGWDIFNTDEVAPEEKASKGRVDYAFKLHGVSQFYLETKPLRADLNKPEYKAQIITYAYNKGVTWAVLTDFESLQVFNAQTGQHFLNLNHKDYLSNFDKLWLLSRESIASGLLNKEAAQYGALPPTIPIERRLYEQLRQWREELFTQIYHYNPGLSFSLIDEIIQRFFNRLIFIRTCEDRGIEERTLLSAINQWKTSGHKGELIESIKAIFRQFDGYYDSDLFLLHPVDQIHIESETVEHIVTGLYQVPGGLASYDFSVIDADILGAVYEQYLGHVANVVKLRAKEAQARMDLGLYPEVTVEVTAKRQRRKEQGIFYTPKFVTNYIIKETLGHLLQERSYDDILNLKILDLACGSGSFLIRAYDELLSYHADNRGKSVSEFDQWERLPILTKNIFGVDLDTQAVEITRLNLLLRSVARRETLPSLSDNIRRGNSLISGTQEELNAYFGDSWREKNPFNWEQEFKDIMSRGGFDVVIGNPPYIRIQALPKDDADYYRDFYKSAFGSFDIYVLFLEQAVKLLKPGGRLGFITSGKFLKSDYGKRIQQILHKECAVESLIDLSAQQVFAEATTYPVIIVLKKGAEAKPIKYLFISESIDPSKLAQPLDVSGLPTITTTQEAITEGIWPPPVGASEAIMAKLAQKATLLGELTERIFQGLVTGADNIYILDKHDEPSEGKIKVYSRSLKRTYELESGLLKPLLMGKDIKRYGYPIHKQFLLFPYKVVEGKAELISPQEFASTYPNCWEYLLQNRKTLENREQGKMRHERWYTFGRIQSLAMHEHPKLLTGVLANKSRFTFDQEGVFYFMGGGNAGGYGVTLKSDAREDYLYILALLNSTLLEFNLRKISSPFRGGFFSYARRYIEKLPIHCIDLNKPTDRKMYDSLVALVDRILELNKKLRVLSEFEAERRQALEKEIRHTNREIDNLVYKLYGLTEEEIKVVESQQS